MEMGIVAEKLCHYNGSYDNISHYKWLVIGDYGCDKRVPMLEEIIELNEEMRKKDSYVHYISPKINVATIEQEYQKIKGLFEQGIPVSINDWGLFYKVRPLLSSTSSVYLGRLLTKSICNWAWADIFLSKENQDSKAYLSQNSFQQKLKLDRLKEWHITGIEVSAHHAAEESYKAIQQEGIQIIGYVHNQILAVSRACPIARMNVEEVSKSDCRALCLGEPFIVKTADLSRQATYPQMQLSGNVLMKRLEEEVGWNGYDKLFYYKDGEDAKKHRD